MRAMKPIVKRMARWFGWLTMVCSVVVFVGMYWGLTPMPKPPRGVRITPHRPPLTLSDVKTNNAAYYYLKANAQMAGYEQAGESKIQMCALLSGDESVSTTAIEQTLRDCTGALQLVRTGAAMERCQMPLWEGKDATDIAPLSGYRQLGSLLCCAGELARRQGNLSESLADYLQVMKFGSDFAQGRQVIGWLVGNAVSSIGAQSLRRVVLQDQLGADTCRSLAVELMQMDASVPPLAEALRYELIENKELAKALWKTNRAATAMIYSSYSQLADAGFGDLIQEAQKPYWENKSGNVTEKWETTGHSKWLLKFDRPFPRTLLSIALPGPKAFERQARWHVELRATAIVCALAGYAQAHGVPPDRLEQLVPAFLPSVPVDPCDGQLFRYRRENGEWMLWSVGADMKDDNATHHEFKYRKSSESPSGGDIYFKSTEPKDDLEWSRRNPTRANCC
jgi:hypothetical protein